MTPFIRSNNTQHFQSSRQKDWFLRFEISQNCEYFLYNHILDIFFYPFGLDELINAHKATQSNFFSNMLQQTCELQNFISRVQWHPFIEANSFQQDIRNSTKTCFQNKLVLCGCPLKEFSSFFKFFVLNFCGIKLELLLVGGCQCWQVFLRKHVCYDIRLKIWLWLIVLSPKLFSRWFLAKVKIL